MDNLIRPREEDESSDIISLDSLGSFFFIQDDFFQSNSKLLDQIDLTVEYHLIEIEIHIKWSSNTDVIHWILPYLDDECTLPSCTPLYYLCSSKSSSLNPSFYPYWFLLDPSFYHRLFSSLTLDDDHFLLLLSLPDGRIIALPESTTNLHPIIWYTSSSAKPVQILAFHYDLNTNLIDAVLSSTSTSKFPRVISNHLLLCDPIGCLILLNSFNLRRVLIDNFIQSACIYSNQLIYLTNNEIRSIAISTLLKPSNEDLINRTKIRRFGHFDKLIVDGQEIILYYQNGTFERLNNLLPHSTNPSRIQSLSNQTKKLAFLTTTIINLQSQACLLQRRLTKIEMFYQLNPSNGLKFVHNQWKLILNEQQLRIFQPNDFLLILVCQLASNDIRIYQFPSSNNWVFKPDIFISICQPILVLRYQNQVYCQLGPKKILLPLQERIPEEEFSLENYFPNKFKPTKRNQLASEQYHLALTIRNEAAWNFKKLNLNFARRINGVNIDCKQQEIKVDTDAGLVDALTVQIILSSSCLRRLIITYSTLIEVFYGSKTIEEKNFIKQTDILKLTELIQDTQTKFSNLADEFLLNLLQIRIYFSLFRLGSNYTVQVY